MPIFMMLAVPASLYLCAASTQPGQPAASERTTATATAGMPLRETVYQRCACKMQLTPRLSGPTVPVALSAQAPRPLRGAKTRINHARPVKLADRSTGRVCARGSVDHIKRISEAGYQCEGVGKGIVSSLEGPQRAPQSFLNSFPAHGALMVFIGQETARQAVFPNRAMVENLKRLRVAGILPPFKKGIAARKCSIEVAGIFPL